MAKLDVYLRSIEKFGATGALLASGQAVTLRFPTGDRHATQVTPHSQLVQIVREVAPPIVIDQIESGRPARFELESGGNRYTLNVTPRGDVWQVAIDGAGAAAGAGAAESPAAEAPAGASASPASPASPAPLASPASPASPPTRSTSPAMAAVTPPAPPAASSSQARTRSPRPTPATMPPPASYPPTRASSPTAPPPPPPPRASSPPAAPPPPPAPPAAPPARPSAAMAAAVPPPARASSPLVSPPLPRGRATAPVPVPGGPQEEVTLERGQYDSSALPTVAPGGTTLEQLTRAARAASASDLYLSAGAVAVHRLAGGDLVSAGAGIIDGDVIARELGVVAPAEARAAWSEQGTAMFTYGDGLGRVRVTLARDHRGPSAALRLLPDDPPPLAQLGLGDAAPAVDGWLDRRGLIVIAGPSGSGKTVTLGALIRALGQRRRRVVAIEDPIELVHASAWISQRAVGEHVASVSAGVACAMNEGADAIVIGRVCSEATAWGVVEAVSGGHLVLATVVAPVAGVALDRMIAHLAADQRELAHGLLFSALLGTIQPIVGKAGERSFEITSPQT